MDNEKINSISVITSTICNLNCKFCYLHKNNSYKEYHKLLTQAWENGDYVNNVKLALMNLNHDLNDIEQVHFWGGETLIQIDLIQKNVSKFYEIFPNLQEWHMSTNWVIDVDKFFNFVKEVDNNASQKTMIIVQISIDGPPGPISDNGHDGWKYYRDNFSHFLNLVNNYKFKHINIYFHFKSTLSKESYLKNLSTYDGLYHYMKYMKDFAQEIDNQCINRAVNIRELFTLPMIARPFIRSKEDGQKIRDILVLWEEVAHKEFPEEKIPFLFGLNEYNADRIISDSNIECDELLSRYTINYDGTIVECSGVILDYWEPYRQELLAEGEIELYQQALINMKNCINPIIATPEEISKWKWKVQRGYRNNSLTYISLMSGVAKELCKSKQISSCYEDEDLLFRQLQSFQNSNGCSKENFQTTGVPYLTSVGNIRSYFNGVMDYGYKLRQRTIKNSFSYEQINQRTHEEQGENEYEYNVGR